MPAIARRPRMVRAVYDEALIPTRDSCVAELEKAKAGVARFYDREKRASRDCRFLSQWRGRAPSRRWCYMNIWAAIRDPLEGKTSLSKVIWLYGLGGSLLVSALGLLLPGSEFARRSYVVFGLVFSVYVTVATYQCAGNTRSKALAWVVRVCAILSLVLLPVLAYLDFTGALDLRRAMKGVGWFDVAKPTCRPIIQ
jgi:hypothetical protein